MVNVSLRLYIRPYKIARTIQDDVAGVTWQPVDPKYLKAG
jgi:hypothetical protein